MGTRADFYVGRGPDAEWIGSTAWDGYPDGFAYDPIGEAQRAIADLKRIAEQLPEHKCTDFSNMMTVHWHAVPLNAAIEVLETLVPAGEPHVTHPVFDVTSDIDFRNAFDKHIATRKDFTHPDEGWPWPWDDSETTDYAYAFDDGKVWGYSYKWFDVMAQLNETEEETEARIERDNAEYEKTGYVRPEDRNNPYPFPNMKARKNVQWGSDKGGVILIRGDGQGGIKVDD